MPGELEPEYIAARRVLLDGLEALTPHLAGLTLVGAQAVYLHTGSAAIAVPEYTTDADMAVNPDLIAANPLLVDALSEAGFQQASDIGRWMSPDGIYLDLLVSESLAGPGRRGADLGPHGRRAARRAHGLEAALVDREIMTIAALDPEDRRSINVVVAGPAALLVAKTIKIKERTGSTGRAVDKDSLDVLRLLRAVSTPDLESGIRHLLRDEISSSTTAEAIEAFRGLFSGADSEGTVMAVRAASPLEDPEVVALSTISLAGDFLEAVGR